MIENNNPIIEILKQENEYENYINFRDIVEHEIIKENEFKIALENSGKSSEKILQAIMRRFSISEHQ